VTAQPTPTTGALDVPRVTSVQATVRAGRHGWRVGWLPGGGWFCGPDKLSPACVNPRGCEHITAVRDALGGTSC
jgi:hypothetical protein